MRSPDRLLPLLVLALLCGVIALAPPAISESPLTVETIAWAHPPSKAETPLALQAVASLSFATRA